MEMFARSPNYGVYISQLILFARVCSNVDDFNNRNLFLTAKLLKQGYRYRQIIEKHFLNSTTDTKSFVKYNIGLKHFSATMHIRTYIYGDLVYKFKQIVGTPIFGD